ncbi:hypothetical protein ON010_g6847 [Phytophthora cinnamomi]|nr:hypothetical protein ON010_g6847 [Phytophthora cinnamomi]
MLADISRRRHWHRDSSFKESVVIKPRHYGRPVRPASTASLQSKPSVEQANAPDDFVFGLDDASEEVTEVTDLTEQLSFRFGYPSEIFGKDILFKRIPQQPRQTKHKTSMVSSAKVPSEKHRQRKASAPPSPRRERDEPFKGL